MLHMIEQRPSRPGAALRTGGKGAGRHPDAQDADGQRVDRRAVVQRFDEQSEGW